MRRDEASMASQYLEKLRDLETNALLQNKSILIAEFRTAIDLYHFKEQIFFSNPENYNKNIFHYLTWAPAGQELSTFFHELNQLNQNISPNPLWEKMSLDSYHISPMQYAFIKGNLQYARLIFDFQCDKSPTEAISKLHDVSTTLLQMLANSNYSHVEPHRRFLEYAFKRIEDVIRLKENNVESQNGPVTKPVHEKTIHAQAETIQNEAQRLEKELLTVKRELECANDKLLTSGLIKACELYQRVTQAREDDRASIAQLHQSLSSTAAEVRVLNDVNLEKDQQISTLTAEVKRAHSEIAELKLQLSKANPPVTNIINLNSTLKQPLRINPENRPIPLCAKHATITQGNQNTTGPRNILPNSLALFRPNKRTAIEELQSLNKCPRPA